MLGFSDDKNANHKEGFCLGVSDKEKRFIAFPPGAQF